MKVTFTNSGIETDIIINDDGQFKKFIEELKSIVEGSDQFKNASFQKSSYIEISVPAEFIKNSIIKVDYSNHA